MPGSACRSRPTCLDLLAGATRLAGFGCWPSQYVCACLLALPTCLDLLAEAALGQAPVHDAVEDALHGGAVKLSHGHSVEVAQVARGNALPPSACSASSMSSDPEPLQGA